MIVGKWNKSVILTYAGMLFAVLGMVLAFTCGKINYAMCCLMVAGVCDLFDGMVARRCKRTEEEKKFGIELDSIVDTLSFVALPVCIFISMGLTKVWDIVIFMFFALAGVARLAYFNVCQEENDDKDSPIKYYTGMPVTYAALIFPVIYLLHVWLGIDVASYLLCACMAVMAVFYILRIKFIKPGKKGYIFLMLLAIAMFVLYIIFGR